MEDIEFESFQKLTREVDAGLDSVGVLGKQKNKQRLDVRRRIESLAERKRLQELVADYDEDKPSFFEFE